MTLADVSPGMLATAKHNILEAGLASQVDTYHECSIYDLPFRNGEFDHAISLNVFNHLERPKDALEKLTQAVASGSTLLFNYANLHSYYWPIAHHINKNKKAFGKDVYSSWERSGYMRNIIGDSGLELIYLLGQVHVPVSIQEYPVYPVLRLLDTISRRGLLSRAAPFHFCLCRKL